MNPAAQEIDMKKILLAVAALAASAAFTFAKELVTSAPPSGLVLNFQSVPLSAVVNYLSEKAGLIVISDVDLNGRVSIVSGQPISTNEIVDILSTALSKNNYAVALNGRTLTIMTADQARTSSRTPVMPTHSKPEEIPASDQIVTAILPVNTLRAEALIKDLQPLIPQNAAITANEAGNSILMTAPMTEIHRVCEIILALDTTAVSQVEVFILKFADAKTLASELKDVFQTSDSSTSAAATRNNFGGFGGPPGFGGPGGPGGFGGPGGGNSDQSSTKNSNTKTSFVADDQMNAVVASAPPDYMRMVSNLVAELDKPNQSVTELRVMRLKHADPGEIVDEINLLFPSSDSSSSSSQSDRSMGFQFGGRQQQSARSGGNSTESARMQKLGTVSAVADRRVQSVILSASHALMEQVQHVVRDLDEGTQGVQIVRVMDYGAADPVAVQSTLAGLFSSTTSGKGSSASTAASTSPLDARYTANANAQSTAVTSSSSLSSTLGGTSH